MPSSSASSATCVRPLPGQLLITTMNALRRRDLEIAHRRLTLNREARRQSMIDMVPIAVFAKDPSGCYVMANAKAEEIVGVEPGESLGRTDDAVLPGRDAEGYGDGDEQVLAGAAGVEREDTVEREGRWSAFRTIGFLLFDETGAVVAVGGVAVDVTAERRRSLFATDRSRNCGSRGRRPSSAWHGRSIAAMPPPGSTSTASPPWPGSSAPRWDSIRVASTSFATRR